MSFLNNVKKLTEDQKLDFQIHVIKFFKSLAPAQRQESQHLHFQNSIHTKNPHYPSSYNINTPHSAIQSNFQTNYAHDYNYSFYHNMGTPSTVSTPLTHPPSDILQQPTILNTSLSSSIPTSSNPYSPDHIQ